MEQINNNSQVILFVRVPVKEDSIEKAKLALQADVVGAWGENGNTKMELYQANNFNETFYIFERWDNEQSLQHHFIQPYTKAAFDLQQNDLTDSIEMNYLIDILPIDKQFIKEKHTPLTTLIVPFETQVGKGEELVSLFASFVPLVRQEPGNIDFHFHKVTGSDTKFVLYERWADKQSLETHAKLSSTMTFVQQVQNLLTHSVQDAILIAVDISNQPVTNKK